MGTFILTVVLGLLVCGGFIILGRWIYRNPKTMYVSSLSAGSESPLRNSAARAFATLLIVLGSFGAATGSASLLLHGTVAIMLVGTVAGVLGAVFLRPSVGAQRSPTGIAKGAAVRHKPFLTRKGRVFFATMAAGVLLSTAEALILPALGKGALWPDSVAVTILVTAVVMLCEILLVK